jgi:hypothetical protein
MGCTVWRATVEAYPLSPNVPAWRRLSIDDNKDARLRTKVSHMLFHKLVLDAANKFVARPPVGNFYLK